MTKGVTFSFSNIMKKTVALDATEEPPHFQQYENIGRLINHSTEANIVPRVVTDTCNVPHLYFVSSKRIEKDEQLFFSYGDNRRNVIKENLWLKKTSKKRGSNRGSNYLGTFINDEAEVSGDDSGDESQVLEETESDKEFLNDNLSETSDIPPNPYLDKVSDKEFLDVNLSEHLIFHRILTLIRCLYL